MLHITSESELKKLYENRKTSTMRVVSNYTNDYEYPKMTKADWDKVNEEERLARI